jgi:hypothetical protein
VKLIFVYNANSGTLNSLFDSAHKIVSPKTYDCNLCDLTFGVFAEKEAWKNFREASAIEMIFLHKDEFLKQYRSKWLPKYNFPSILSAENDKLEIFITPEELNEIDTVEDLIEEIQHKITLFQDSL